MGKKIIGISILFLGLYLNFSFANTFCNNLNGASIIANDGTYLGELSSNTISDNSIANTIGSYGSSIRSDSILNTIGTYGRTISTQSPRNKITTDAPTIVKDGEIIGKLTINTMVSKNIDPLQALLCFISIDDDRLKPFLKFLKQDNTYSSTNNTIIPIATLNINTLKTANERCIEQYGIYAIATDEPNTCKCKDGYAKGYGDKVCKSLSYEYTPEEMQAILDIPCQNSLGSGSKAVSKNGSISCVCKDGFSLSNGKCLDTMQLNENNKICKKDFGSGAESSYYGTSSKNGKTMCNCSKGFIWGNDSKCISELEQYIPAIKWMYESGLTSKSNITDFLPYEFLTREQASKFFVEFAKKILNKNPNNNTSVNFSDLKKADSSLQEHIKNAYKLGLFKGVRGNFLPQNKISIAQAIAVLIRMKDGIQDESKAPWYQVYYNIAEKYGIIDGLGFEIKSLDQTHIARKDVAMLLYRLNNYVKLNPSVDQQCKNTYGKYSYFNVSTNKCGCEKRYTRNKSYTQCITVDAACKEDVGVHSYSAITDEQISRGMLNWCACEDGYRSVIDSNGQSSCIK